MYKDVQLILLLSVQALALSTLPHLFYSLAGSSKGFFFHAAGSRQYLSPTLKIILHIVRRTLADKPIQVVSPKTRANINVAAKTIQLNTATMLKILILLRLLSVDRIW
jgi:hypothetical protein